MKRPTLFQVVVLEINYRTFKYMYLQLKYAKTDQLL